jgi:hypothetical protein
VLNEPRGVVAEVGPAFKREAEVVCVNDVQEGKAEGGLSGFGAVGLPPDVKGVGVGVGDAVVVVGVVLVPWTSAPGEKDTCFVKKVK